MAYLIEVGHPLAPEHPVANSHHEGDSDDGYQGVHQSVDDGSAVAGLLRGHRSGVGQRLPRKLPVAVVALAAAEQQVLPRLLFVADALRLVVTVGIVQKTTLQLIELI